MGSNPKKSVAKIAKGSVPKLATPAQTGSSIATPKVGMKDFNKMKRFL